MTKFPNPPMYPSQVQLLEQNLTIEIKNNSWISRLGSHILESCNQMDHMLHLKRVNIIVTYYLEKKIFHFGFD